MVKGKPWTSEDEKKLRALFEEKKPISVLMKVLGKSRNSIDSKIRNLGLKEEEVSRKHSSSSRLEIPKDLPTVEEALQMLAGAVKSYPIPSCFSATATR